MGWVDGAEWCIAGVWCCDAKNGSKWTNNGAGGKSLNDTSDGCGITGGGGSDAGGGWVGCPTGTGRRGARMMGAPPGPATSNACRGGVCGAWTRWDALTASEEAAPGNNIELSAARPYTTTHWHGHRCFNARLVYTLSRIFNSDSDENLIWTDKTRILVLTNENCTFGVNAVELYHATIPLTVRVIDYVTHETLM